MSKANIFLKPAPSGAIRFRRLLRLLVSIMAFMVLLPPVALATQIHGHPEGLYVHLMAHIFFASSLVFLLYVLHRRPISSSKGWRYLKLSLLFFLLWNIDTFMVHWLSLRLPADALVMGRAFWLDRIAGPMTMERWIYYWGRMDHLLCVPAMGFLVLSLKKFTIEVEHRHSDPNSGGDS